MGTGCCVSDNGGHEGCSQEGRRRPSWRSGTRISQALLSMLRWASWYNGEMHLYGASRSARNCQICHCQVQGDVSCLCKRSTQGFWVLELEGLYSTGLVLSRDSRDCTHPKSWMIICCFRAL